MECLESHITIINNNKSENCYENTIFGVAFGIMDSIPTIYKSLVYVETVVFIKLNSTFVSVHYHILVCTTK